MILDTGDAHRKAEPVIDWFRFGQTVRCNSEVKRQQKRNQSLTGLTLWNAAKDAYLGLRLAQTLFGASIPAEVLAALKPVDVTPAIETLVQARLFISRPQVSKRFMTVIQRGSAGVRLRALGQVVLPSLQEMRTTYNIPTGDWRVILAYPYRWAIRIGRYWRILWRMLRGDRTLVAVAVEYEALTQWLDR